MTRKLLITCSVLGMIFVLSFPVHAEVKPANVLTLEETLWELQDEIIEGVDHIGFYEDNIYACNDAISFLCLPLPYSEYSDFYIVSFFSWEVSSDVIDMGFDGIAFPVVGIGFLITDEKNFSLLIKSDDNWNPFPF
jgi:hypothetical protein